MDIEEKKKLFSDSEKKRKGKAIRDLFSIWPMMTSVENGKCRRRRWDSRMEDALSFVHRLFPLENERRRKNEPVRVDECQPIVRDDNNDDNNDRNNNRNSRRIHRNNNIHRNNSNR